MTVKTIKIGDKERKIAILTEEEKEKRSDISKRICNELNLPECVYSYVKGKSAKQAINDIKENIAYFQRFLKCDIKEFFSNIDIDILLNIVQRKLNNEFLYQGLKEVLEEDRDKFQCEGLILGSPLSNHLSNLYLIEFDEFYYKKPEIKYYRFCDDMFFLYNDEIELVEIENKLNKLKLTLNYEKLVKGKSGDEVEYLGQKILKPKNKLPRTTEEILELFRTKKKITSEQELKNFKCFIYNNLDKQYEYIFRNYFLKEDKDALIEEMLDNNLYKEVYSFEEAIMELEEENNLFNIFQKQFLKNNSFYYEAVVKEELEYKRIENPITEAIFKEHLNGEKTLAINLNNGEDKSNILVIDIDDKKSLVKAKELSIKIQHELEKRDIISYLEFSGNKGYHIWIFFDKFIDIKDLNMFMENILNFLKIRRSKVELIPRYNNICESEHIIKLPLGVHPISRKKSYFEELSSIKNILDNTFINNEETLSKLWSYIEENYNDIYRVASKCSILNNIINYGIIKQHMSHFDRLTLTYVFPKMKDGEEFIHIIMEHLNNYSSVITSKYIAKAPENTISCRKLKEYYKNSDFVCNNCIFNNKGVYDSPILHSSNEDIILLSAKNKVKDIVEEIIRLQQEKKKIEKESKKLEKRLTKLHEEIGGESIDLPMGKLKKIDNKWIIEIEV